MFNRIYAADTGHGDAPPPNAPQSVPPIPKPPVPPAE